LDRFEKIGPGATVPHADLETVSEYMIMLMLSQAPKITTVEATDLARFLQWGTWAEGWESGYASGTRKSTPHFSLNN
jgi:hypothetical protein